MPHLYREHLITFTEEEIPMVNHPDEGLIVVFELHPTPDAVVTRSVIQNAIWEDCGLQVPIQRITKFRSDYLVRAGANEEATKMVNTPIQIHGRTIAAFLWTPFYRSHKMPLDSR